MTAVGPVAPVEGAATGVGLLLAAGLLALAVPLPFLEGFLTSQVQQQVSSQVACPGALAQPPSVRVKGRLLPQVLRKRFPELQLSVPDATLARAVFEWVLAGIDTSWRGTAGTVTAISSAPPPDFFSAARRPASAPPPGPPGRARRGSRVGASPSSSAKCSDNELRTATATGSRASATATWCALSTARPESRLVR